MYAGSSCFHGMFKRAGPFIVITGVVIFLFRGRERIQ